MTVVPAEIPVTTPVVPTAAMPGLTLLHTPPAVASVSATTAPGHTTGSPVMIFTAGIGMTVTTLVAALVPQLLLTV